MEERATRKQCLSSSTLAVTASEPHDKRTRADVEQDSTTEDVVAPKQTRTTGTAACLSQFAEQWKAAQGLSIECWQRGLQQFLDRRRASGPGITESEVRVTLDDAQEFKHALAQECSEGRRVAAAKVSTLFSAAVSYADRCDADALLHAVLGRVVAQTPLAPTRLGTATSSVDFGMAPSSPLIQA